MKWLSVFSLVSPTVACLVSVACSTPEPAVKPSEHVPEIHGAAEAPLSIDAKVDRRVAHVQLIFGDAGSGVTVSTRGVRGLVVPQEIVAVDLAVAAGQLLAFEVAFEPAVTPSLLAVEVRGTFGGNERVKIRTFEIPGTKPTPPEHDTTKVIRGERIKVVPAQ